MATYETYAMNTPPTPIGIITAALRHPELFLEYKSFFAIAFVWDMCHRMVLLFEPCLTYPYIICRT